MRTRRVGIFIFDDVEVLDFCGPFEVFSVTGRKQEIKPFEVLTIAQRASAIAARNGLSVNPAFTFADCPKLDLLVVPGGGGTRPLLHNNDALNWIATKAGESEMVLSVCTGALLLGKLGLLDGLDATTHHSALDELRAVAPGARVREGLRVVDNGRLIICGGISAGIDGSFHVVRRLLGEATARETAEYMEYRWVGD